ncbi:MAG TPA: energy transducer TonB [Chthoniobacterales bacterium]|jgi:protein TonB
MPDNPGLSIQEPVEALITETPPLPTPPPDEVPPPLPPPPDDSREFTIEEANPPPRPIGAPPPKPTARVASTVGAAAPMGPVALGSAKANMVSMPHPPYPYEARRMRQTGSGKFLLHFNATGAVTNVDVVQSTESPILDQTSSLTFRRWRCRPGVLTRVTVPITYTMEGAQL